MNELRVPGERDLDILTSSLHGTDCHILDLDDRRGRPLGNHGDWLMYTLFRQYLDSRSVRNVPAKVAHAILIPPNGALLDTYQAPSLIRDRLRGLPDIPVVIFPSSARFKKDDPTEMFRGRSAPVTWICREAHSLNHLESAWGAELKRARVALALGHDVVVTSHKGLPGIFPPRQQHGLVAGRLGVESGQVPDTVIVPPIHRRASVWVYDGIPSERIRRAIRQRITRKAQVSAAARLLDHAGPLAQASVHHYKSQIEGDVSDPTLYSRYEYVEAVAGAGAVVTNRLHVAIPAALLGKPTWLMDSGYHKLSGVYERSLSSLPNLTFVRR